MALAAVGNFHDLVEIAITAVSILGGSMAFYSSFEAQRSFRGELDPGSLAHRINLGLAKGFRIGLPVATILSATLLI